MVVDYYGISFATLFLVIVVSGYVEGELEGCGLGAIEGCGGEVSEKGGCWG